MLFHAIYLIYPPNSSQLTRRNGIMFLNGEPIKRTIAFINVKGIDKLYAFVKDNGWDEITEVEKQPWGGRTCKISTIDDCVLTFSEADNN